MSKKVETYGQIKGGKIHYTRAKEFASLIKKTFKEGEYFKVCFEKRYKKRSTMQNAYYWGVVVSVIQEHLELQGDKFADEEIHELLKLKCLEKRQITNKLTGETLEVLGPTTSLTTTGMCEYIESCRQWGAEFFGLYIPAPNEQSEIELND